jgi:glycine/D-amino acid oxidase-like deaminating enzyme
MRVAVIGGGLAGRSVAAALSEAGVEVDVFDAGGPRASDVPSALCHAYPGRTFAVSKAQIRAWEVASRWYSRGSGAVLPVTIRRRPDARLERTHAQAAQLPVEVVLDREGTSYGGFVVDMRRWVEGLALSGELVMGHADLEAGTKPRVRCQGRVKSYDRVVVCPGAALGGLLPGAEIRVTYGELLVCDGEVAQAQFGRAHVYPAVGGGHVVGHTFLDEVRSDELAEAALRGMAREDGVEPGPTREVWRQARTVVHPDRWPILTQLGPDVVALGALGAKGLLFSPVLAESVVRWVTDDAALPEEFRWPRVSTRAPD